MRLEYSFTYLRCPSCAARVHCGECRAQVEAALRAAAGVRSAAVDMEAKRLLLEVEGLDPLDVEELLEDEGIFAL